MRGSVRGAAPFAPGHGVGRSPASFFNHRRSAYPGGYLGDLPLFYNDDSLPQPTPDSGMQFIAMQPLGAGADAPPQPKPSPLLIELEGDRYVRYGGSARSYKNTATQRDPAREPLATTGRQHKDGLSQKLPSAGSESAQALSGNNRVAGAASTKLVPTILIYRDGHREQIPDYAIVGRVLYAHDDQEAQPAYGMRNIQLSALDIQATVEANRENGVNFVLPAGPNEVVTRP
ncbi:MAG: hypothetical protein WCC04_20165 [Terriglobales bacterium]